VENPRRFIIYPSRRILVLHNKKIIEASHGAFFPPENLLNPNSLDWVLGAIRAQVFGKDIYPSICDKASLLCWTIINDHIFFDGNKRTGMFAMQTFLSINDQVLFISTQMVVELALKIATYRNSGFSRAELKDWIDSKINL